MIDTDFVFIGFDDDHHNRLCSTCNGSGEGLYEGSRCRDCLGSGEARTAAERAEAEDCDEDPDDFDDEPGDIDSDECFNPYTGGYDDDC